jgi:hypothetical protein
LRSAVDGSKGRRMYGLRGVVGTSREALQYWVLPVDWLEYGGKQIKLGLKYPRWGGNRYVSRRREGIHVTVGRAEGGLNRARDDISIQFMQS